MLASVAGMTSGSYSNIATYQNIRSYIKMESLSKRNRDLKMKIVFLDVRKALKLRGKWNIRNMKTDLKQTMKNFVT